MRYAGILLVGVSILIGLSGCSAAYQNAKDVCEKLGQSKYTPRYETKTVNKVRVESVPDGNIRCHTPQTYGNSQPQTTCTQGTRLISIPYTAVETVDVEEERRSSYVSDCINRACPEGFTDTKCSNWKDRPSSSGGSQKGFDALRRGDYATALREWKLPAEQGHAQSQYELGELYNDGTGVPQDEKTALKWYRLAAEQGYAAAQGKLGAMYAIGRGVLKDYMYAHMWGSFGASNGNEKGRQVRDFVAKNMTPTQIVDAKKLARECVRKKYKGC